MDKKYEAKYHSLEEDQWWFVGRRQIIKQLIGGLNLDRNVKILEIGCSGGSLLKDLARVGFADLAGIDISREGIRLAKKRGLKNVQVMDGAKTTFPSQHFDLIIASDVLEHIDRDKAALEEWRRVLKTKGKLIIFVPAFSFLWSSHDVINHHYRRYSRAELLRRLREGKFNALRSSYWNTALFLPISLVRFLQRAVGSKSVAHEQLNRSNPLVNSLLVALLAVENWLLRFIDLPAGVSVFTVAEKR